MPSRYMPDQVVGEQVADRVEVPGMERLVSTSDTCDVWVRGHFVSRPSMVCSAMAVKPTQMVRGGAARMAADSDPACHERGREDPADHRPGSPAKMTAQCLLLGT